MLEEEGGACGDEQAAEEEVELKHRLEPEEGLVTLALTLALALALALPLTLSQRKVSYTTRMRRSVPKSLTMLGLG